MKPSDYPNRQEYIKDLIVGAMMDDFESFEIIVTCVTEFASAEGESIPEIKIGPLLKELIQADRVHVYDLHVSQKEPVPYSDERLHELWYYPSPDERVAYMLRHDISG